MIEWMPIESAPIKSKVVVGSAAWDGIATARWESVEAKDYELKTWVDGPTHWLSGLASPQPKGD